jgi:hypothetical protein
MFFPSDCFVSCGHRSDDRRLCILFGSSGYLWKMFNLALVITHFDLYFSSHNEISQVHKWKRCCWSDHDNVYDLRILAELFLVYSDLLSCLLEAKVSSKKLSNFKKSIFSF